MSNFVVAALVSNHSGVLTRVSGMFTRRGFNIDTLTVGETESPEYSRITISADGDEYSKNQIIKQLDKLHDVKKVEVLSDNATVYRELVLIKVKNSRETREQILPAVDIFHSKVVDYSPESFCIEITGETTKTGAFIEFVKPFGIIEMCRTGLVALERGGNCLNTINQ